MLAPHMVPRRRPPGLHQRPRRPLAIGVYDVAAESLRYLDPSTDYDSEPEWSPDGHSIAFMRIPSSGLRAVAPGPRGQASPGPFASPRAETGAGREIWRAHEGPGSVFREVTARNQFLWADGGRLVFPWEGDGWTHLYSVPAEGGQPALLTPGAFEVEDVALAPGRREVVFSSNQGDIDRRHLWKVAAAGGTPRARSLPDRASNGRRPPPATATPSRSCARTRSIPCTPPFASGTDLRDLDPAAIPADFPAQHMVTPRQVIFASADGLTIHGQLFLPPGKPAAAAAPRWSSFTAAPRRQMLLGWHYMYYYSNAYALNQYLANSGYVVLSVNFRSGIGYGLDFREALALRRFGRQRVQRRSGRGRVPALASRCRPRAHRAWGGSYGGYLMAMALGARLRPVQGRRGFPRRAQLGHRARHPAHRARLPGGVRVLAHGRS